MDDDVIGVAPEPRHEGNGLCTHDDSGGGAAPSNTTQTARLSSSMPMAAAPRGKLSFQVKPFAVIGALLATLALGIWVGRSPPSPPGPSRTFTSSLPSFLYAVLVNVRGKTRYL